MATKKTTEEYKVTDYHDFLTKDSTPEEREKYHTGDIWINAAKCLKCGDTVRSRNQHDFRRCTCGAIAVDGGSWYGRRIGHPEDMENIIEMFTNVEDNRQNI